MPDHVPNNDANVNNGKNTSDVLFKKSHDFYTKIPLTGLRSKKYSKKRYGPSIK